MTTRLAPTSLDSSPVCLRPVLILTAAYVASTIAVPPGARRVTFHIRATRGAAGAGNRQRFALGWGYKGSDDASPAGTVVAGHQGQTSHESREPQTDPANLAVSGSEAIMPVGLGAWNGPLVAGAPPLVSKWHETFEVPAGIESLTFYALEFLDVANFPLLAVDVAFSGTL